MKIFLGLAFAIILAALAAAGVFMVRRPRDGGGLDERSRMAKALTVRIGVSVAVFLLLLFSWAMGWIQPTGLPAGR
jgi:hypothetical protein